MHAHTHITHEHRFGMPDVQLILQNVNVRSVMRSYLLNRELYLLPNGNKKISRIIINA